HLMDDPGGWSLETGSDAVELFTAVGLTAISLIVPVVAVLGVFGIAASFLQNPPQLVADRIQPKLSRLSITKGWSRIFGQQGWVEFAKSVFKLGAVAILSFIIIRAGQYDVMNSMFADPYDIPRTIRTLSVQLLLAIICATAVLVALDLVWSRMFW